MSQASQKPMRSIRTLVIKVFIFVFVLAISTTLALQYYFSHSTLQKSTELSYRTEANRINKYVVQTNAKAITDGLLLANFTRLTENKKITPKALQMLTMLMHNNPAYHSISVGFDNGNVQQLVNLNNAHNDPASQSMASDRWLLISINGQGEQRIRTFYYFDQSFNLRKQYQEETNYDLTQQAWFQDTVINSVKKSKPYLFPYSKTFGQTYSIKVPETNIVLGINMTLNTLPEILQNDLKNSEDKLNSTFHEAYIVTQSGQLIASNQANKAFSNGHQLPTAPYPALIPLIQQKQKLNQLILTTLNQQPYYVYITPINNINGVNKYLALVIPKQQLMAENTQQLIMILLLSLLCLLLLLPFLWLFSSSIVNPLNALQRNIEKVKMRHFKQLTTNTSNISEIQNLDRSLIEMSLSIETYQTEQKQLMESFIKLIAQAIDDKSPYTAGHCNRVPELGLMLVKAAQASNLAPFTDFKFENEDQQQEFNLAAWLHDLGKITTPEHIINKGTKLEANYNRIHEIRMRFEVLWRDAEITYYQQSRAHPERNKPLKEALIKEQLQLMRDFEFVAKANIGDTFMVQQDILRLQKIGEQTWLRYFDDRLGLSLIEELNLTGKKQKLPVTEKLLSDKNEHIIKRDNQLEFDPKFAIKMQVPKYLYNLGELYNLSISSGTLTVEDRFKINQNVASTIKILDSLHFPPELANVPRYASTHSENLKGTGYPRQLSAKDLSIPERILVIADIFEALTTIDRPYKKAKSLSIAIDILYNMALQQDVDMDIFKLFLSSGIYLQYANKFLDKKQIDTVDIGQYID
ncbi:HD domain-containing phosphohydrolase [uncultured Psychromonas sp.]|uniref:HD domain-containing phosphohydrolase n=1 Tax=uncultured Psychromonas sp. TaxID=173974 RepID=UPI002622E410|nr:HD domain-containing phosphohydrolase [uncultured Psychromonas sp.]